MQRKKKGEAEKTRTLHCGRSRESPTRSPAPFPSIPPALSPMISVARVLCSGKG